jgi:hypothetical protein
VQERLADWSARFGAQLGLNCVEMTGDTATVSWAELAEADIVCAPNSHCSLIWRPTDALRRAKLDDAREVRRRDAARAERHVFPV